MPPATSSADARLRELPELPATHPYARFLRDVEKPARYVGGEPFERRKDWNLVDARVCLAFPDLYEIGMSHLGFKILYKILNDHPRTLAERAYAVWPDMERALRAHGEPLRALESARPLRDFDVVGFSLQYELTYTNVLQMLELGGLPLRADERRDDDPLVLCGGPSGTHAEVLVPFVDAVLLGDGEEKALEIALAWVGSRGLGRAARLAALARIPGVYVPSLYPTHVDDATGFEVVDRPSDAAVPYPVQRTIVPSLDPYPFPTDGPVPTSTAIFDRMGIEIARGCTEGCRFCQAGMIYRPVRERAPEDVLRTIREAIRDRGYDEASLTSLSTADYSAIAPLVRAASDSLAGTDVKLGVSSLRAYGLGEGVLDDLVARRTSGLTFAPEAGTQRLRDVINKNVTEQQLLETAERVFDRGIDAMKLYFMIGLPTETDEDVLGIVETAKRALDVGERLRGRKRVRVTASVSTFVPKPHTPFQWCRTIGADEIARKHAVLRAAARAARVDLRLHAAAGTFVEALLSRSDRRAGALLLAAYREGARFDSWDSEIVLAAWQRALRSVPVDVETMLGTLPVDARLPWDHLDVGLAPGFLAREYRRAVAGRLSPPCGKVAGSFVHAEDVETARGQTRPLVCYRCGVACDMTAMREERVAKLVQLGALRKAPARVVVRSKDGRRMRGVDQGEKARIRVLYVKRAKLAYSAHLDIIRLVPRMLRRAGLGSILAEGFAGRAVVSFGPALGLFVPSLGECFDAEVRADDVAGLDDVALGERLSAAAFDGLEVLAAVRLGPNDAALNRVLAEAAYVLGVPPHLLDEVGGEDGARRSLATALAADTLPFIRDHKGREKHLDARPLLLGADAGEGSLTLARAGLAPGLYPVKVRTRLAVDGGIKPSELPTVLLGLAPGSVSVVREGCYAHDATGRAVSPLDLAAFRRRNDAPRPTDEVPA